MITEVITTEVKHDRTAMLSFLNNTVIFDCSNEEYGPVIFDLALLEKKLEEHKKS